MSALIAGLLLALVACGPAASSVVVSGAWVRATASSTATTAGYLTIENRGTTDDALLGATSPAAGSVEVHETSMDSSGMTGMQPVDKIPVGAGATVRLQQGGYHLMMMGLTRSLTVGGTVELNLRFEHAGTVVVQAEVRQG